MGTLQFIQTTPQQLADLIKEEVKVELQLFKKELLNENANEELLTREQTAELLQINLSTLWSYTCKGKLCCYGISNRRYYKRSEVMGALTLLKK